ncbi:MAG: erg26, C-3 sterol dehydrogenase [Claussenomyces sp. TS43310]|nr:MAG: erg26, C-3 sterol dehydrogenase [Claussenomyces sp. TS43310]
MAPVPPASKQSLGKAVVIGGCGFLGHHIVKLLRESYNCQVSALDLRTTRNRQDGVEYYDGDITNLDSLLKIFGQIKPDVVFHTASPLANVGITKEILHKVNVDGTQCVIDACRQTNVKALVYTSSASVISDNVSDLVNADERWPVLRAPVQTDYYSESKAIAEQAVLAANRNPGSQLLTSAIRPAGIIGEGDVQVVPVMLNLYFDNKMHFQIGTNDNLFDFTYVGNVAHAHCLAAVALLQTARSPTTPLDHERVDGEAFFVTNGSPIYFWDFPRMLWKHAGVHRGTEGVWVITREVGLPLSALAETFGWLTGRPVKFTRKATKYSCMTRYYDISKARNRLGYKPLVGLDEGARRAVEWALNERKTLLEKKGQ